MIASLPELVAVGAGGSCVRSCARSLQFRTGKSCVFHRRKFSRVSLIGRLSLIVLLATENMLLLPLLVIAVDEVAFAMNQEVESAGGSDTMKRKKRNRRERE